MNHFELIEFPTLELNLNFNKENQIHYNIPIPFSINKFTENL